MATTALASTTMSSAPVVERRDASAVAAAAEEDSKLTSVLSIEFEGEPSSTAGIEINLEAEADASTRGSEPTMTGSTSTDFSRIDKSTIEEEEDTSSRSSDPIARHRRDCVEDESEHDVDTASHRNNPLSVPDDNNNLPPEPATTDLSVASGSTHSSSWIRRSASSDDAPKSEAKGAANTTPMDLLSVVSDPTFVRSAPKDRIERILREAIEQQEEHRLQSSANQQQVLDLAHNALLRKTAIRSLAIYNESLHEMEEKESLVPNALSDELRDPSEHVTTIVDLSLLKEDEKKEMAAADANAVHNKGLLLSTPPHEVPNVLSATESEVGSLDGLPAQLHSSWNDDESRREKMMDRLDGVRNTTAVQPSLLDDPQPLDDTGAVKHVHYAQEPSQAAAGDTSNIRITYGNLSKLADWTWGLCGSDLNTKESEEERIETDFRWRHDDDTLALLPCANVIHRRGVEERFPIVPSSLVRVASEAPPPSFAETLHSSKVDPRMQSWVNNQYRPRDKSAPDGTYRLGKSRTIIVHEIIRGNWTWVTEWSPSGDYLAIATENHHLAIVDTTCSTVWRVAHDRRIKTLPKNDTTHSIRSIAWGTSCLAIGGTGNAVSILAPHEPFPVIHVIKGTGFVGSLQWNVKSNILAIGTRLNKCLLVRVIVSDEAVVPGSDKPEVESEILETIEAKNWINRVAFSPGGTCLAVGDASGIVQVFGVVDDAQKGFQVDLITSFTLDDSVLDIEWSPDGKWLYAGGEDFMVSVIDTNHWELVHKVQRDRWVQCIASSNSGTHMAVGGVSAEISLLDVANGWDSVMGIQLKGLVPLSAKWHPRDQYLALTGQNNSILAVETTNARHVSGHHLHSISPILAIEFSPDGRMCIVGNEAGIVTFYSLSGSTFETAYELVVTLNDRLSIRWSRNGQYAAIGSANALILVQRIRKPSRKEKKSKKGPPHASGFSVSKVMRDLGQINAVTIDPLSHFIAVTGATTSILDAIRDFQQVRQWKNKEPCSAVAWSPGGQWLATIGGGKMLHIYDTTDGRVDRWREIFSLQIDHAGKSLAWGPVVVGGLLYLAYGGEGKIVTILEIRTLEGTWETILRIPRDGPINDLDWNIDGLLAVAIGNGTVSIVDLAYLQSGIAANEMDYNWQRQALTCFTEIRRNRGHNSMRSARFIPSAPGSDSLLAIGGTDGEIEIVDLTERRRCRGFG